MKTFERIAVIGAGHGGKAMAAHLALKGCQVTLYNRTYDHISPTSARGGIELESYEGGPRGFGKLHKVTADMQAALEDVELVMVVVPASAHADIAKLAAPFLKDNQVVILNPGRTCGTIEFQKVLCDMGCQALIKLAEAETFLYASRAEGPAQARIFRIKEAVPLAALPSVDTPDILERLSEIFPQFIEGDNVLHTGLNNMGAIFHPTLTLMNAGWIEATQGNFQFYIDGVTPSIARVLEVIDRERVTVASALGIRARTAVEWLEMAYNSTGSDLREAILNQPGYQGIKSPRTLNHRYIFEDIPMSLVPMASLGRQYGVSVRGMDSLIRLACIIHRTDYWRRGRTVEKMGIGRLSVSELNNYVINGVAVYN